MLDKTWLEELKEASISNEPAYVEFYNNGKVRREEHLVDKRMDYLGQDETLRSIRFIFKDGAEAYARKCSYDKISLGLEVGLMFHKEDVGPENTLKEGAKPLDLVHCYTGEITSYLAGEKSNDEDFYKYSLQGFVKYDKLVSEIKKNKLEFDGPQDFEEFKARILNGENFNISLVADLRDKKEVEKVEPKKLKRTFFGNIKKTTNL